MLNDFRKFVGFKILEYFLLNPTKKTYIKELAKELNVSPASVIKYGDIYYREDLIKKEVKGNLHLYYTNNDNFRIRELKRAFYVNMIGELNIDKIAENPISVALYGSHANGTFDEKSDIDLLIIGIKEKINKDLIVKIGNKLGKEIQINIISMTNWENKKKEDDAFVKSVIKNHVLIKGVEL